MNSQKNFPRAWGDWMVQLDEDRMDMILRMTDVEWRNCAREVIADNRGDLRPVLNWLERMDARRAAFRATPVAQRVVRDMSPLAVTFRIWRDMIQEPAKYGDADWEDWLVMNEELLAGPGRWRVAAFWLELEEEDQARLREVYAIRIQAAWRGYRIRDNTPGLNCEGCLSHRPSPKQFNGMYLCRGCQEDLNDCTFEYKFLTPVVPRVPKACKPVPREEPGLVPCDGCGRVVCDEGGYGEYRPGYWCSRRCAYA